MKIKEIIVVEGRDDTNRVKEAIDCDTFETNGSALTKKKIERLIFLEKTRGLIVLTDPDYAGKRIRSIIEKKYPDGKTCISSLLAASIPIFPLLSTAFLFEIYACFAVGIFFSIILLILFPA